MPSESEIISRLKKWVRTSDEVLVGIGDDAAVIKGVGGTDLIACCDLMIEGVHFRTDWSPPRLLGRKALAVNLSDVAAMGGVPKFAMISVALPHKFSSESIDELFAGLFDMANACGVSIIGGDTSTSRDSLFIDVSVIGECATGKSVTRAGAKPGDRIYVSGSLGASALGLLLLEQGFRLDDSKNGSDAMRHAVLRHLAPVPQLKLGRSLGQAGLATAMIDISDGLSTDLWHILDESGCGAILQADEIPIAKSVRSMESAEIDPLELALHGGEEYELLFTARPENWRQLVELSDAIGVTVTAIGEILEGNGLKLERDGTLEPLLSSGYQHLV